MSVEFEPQLSILVVDDQPGALENLVDILEDQGYCVTSAATGQAAREAFATREFDVALLDIRLPDVHGTDLLREIRRAHNATRCIMVTASDDAEDAINALNDGASAYISKPIDIPHLLDRIRDVVTKYRQTMVDRRQLHDLDVVMNIGEAAMELDLDVMLDGVLAASVTGFGAHAGAVLLLERDEVTLRGAAQHEFVDDDIGAFVTSVGEGFAGRVAARGAILMVEDLAGAGYTLSTYLARSGLVSIIGAPVTVSKGLLGVILIGWRSPRAFTFADENLIQVISQRLGLALENARLYAREDASKRRAEYLARVSKELNIRIENVRDVVERITQLATERLGDGCAIFVKRPGDENLDTILSYHRIPEKQRVIQAHLRRNPIRIGEGNVGRAVESGDSVVSGAESASVYPDRPYLADVGIQGAMAVPLRAHGEVFGAMSVSITESGRRYTADDLNLAEELAERAAVAIENARLLKQSKERQQQMQSLYEMSRMVTSTLDEAAVFDSLLQGTVELMSAPVACVATVSSQGERLHVNCGHGISREDAEAVVDASFAAWGEPLLHRNAPFLVEDLTRCGEPSVEARARQHDLRSMTSIPFDVEGESGGMLCVFTRQVDPRLDESRQMLSTIGSLAGVAVTNARSYQRELRIAERLQEWILAPETNVDMGVFEVATEYRAALNEATVGGDLYDIFSAGTDLVGVVIGDVSGKGLEAALQAQAVKHTLRAHALGIRLSGAVSPADLLSRTNDAVCFTLPSDIFITLFFALVNVRTGEIRYANAGHDAPILLRADGTAEMLESTGRALGLMPGASYADGELVMRENDCMLLYTDGVTEARREGRFLETEGVVEFLRRHAGVSAREIAECILHDTAAYTMGAIQDDIALLVLRRLAADVAAAPQTQAGGATAGQRT